jgi:hypothetical protein
MFISERHERSAHQTHGVSERSLLLAKNAGFTIADLRAVSIAPLATTRDSKLSVHMLSVCRPSNEEENTQGIVEVNIDQPIDELVDEAARRLSDLTGLKVLE